MAAWTVDAWNSVPFTAYTLSGPGAALSWPKRAAETVNTGSKSSGDVSARASACVTSAAVAPAASRSVRTALALVMRLPTTPTTMWVTVSVSGTPPAPRIAARGGHARSAASVSPWCSAGLIVAGDQATRHTPPRSARRTVVTGFQRRPGAAPGAR